MAGHLQLPALRRPLPDQRMDSPDRRLKPHRPSSIHFRNALIGWLCAVGLGLCFFALPPRASEVGPLPEHRLKALYLYNFTKYLEWPEEAFTNSPGAFTIGLVCGPEVEADIREISKNKEVNGREIVVRRIEQPRDARLCQMIFLQSGETERIKTILGLVKDLPVLTVGASDEFIAWGGMISFARKESNLRVKLDLNAARQARLLVSAKLVAVAERVNSTPGEKRE